MQTPYLFYLSSDVDASLNRVKNILESNAESRTLSSFSYEELDEMIYRLEKISLSCRQAIAEKETPKQLFRNGMFYEIPAEEKPELLSDSLDYKIKITFQNNEMHIKTPFTFKRISNRKSVKENYILIQRQLCWNIWMDGQRSGREMQRGMFRRKHCSQGRKPVRDQMSIQMRM